MQLSRNRNLSDPSAFRTLDWVTVIIYLLMVVFGAVSIYAASYDFDHASMFSFDEFSGKQFRWIILALGLGVIILVSDYRLYETYAYPIYLGFMVLLLVTAIIAPDTKGSRSWLKLGPVSLQPAEFAKCATALALAKLFNTYGFKLNSLKSYARAVGLILLPVVLIICEKETGSALAYMALFFVLYREGMSGMVLIAALGAVVVFVVTVKYTEPMILQMPQWQFMVSVLAMIVTSLMCGLYARSFRRLRNTLIVYAATVGLAFALNALGVRLPWGWIFFGEIILTGLFLCLMSVRDHINRLLVCGIFAIGTVAFSLSVTTIFSHLARHQRERILVSIGAIEDPKGVGYNVNQAMIAIGSGGVEGKGFLNGTQTKLKYVPENHTDFIFCTIGEEQGFVGTTAVILLFLALILRIINIAERQESTFTRVYAYCVASIFIFHLCINVGMVIGLCPVIGIPLPFFSYGGSSLWGFTILLFVLLRLDAARKLSH